MARSWQDVKARKAELDTALGRDMDKAHTEAQARTRAYVLSRRLAELREQMGISQTQQARSMGVSQPRVSQLERGDLAQMEIDTLSRYIAALGGHLRLVADFEDHDPVLLINETGLATSS